MENVTRSIVKEKAGKAIAVASLGARVALAVVASGAMVVASAYAADAVSSLMTPYAPAAASVAVSWSWLAIALALASATAAMAAFRLNAADGLFAHIFLALSVVLPCLVGAAQLCAVGALSLPDAVRDIAAGNASRIADIVLIVALAADLGEGVSARMATPRTVHQVFRSLCPRDLLPAGSMRGPHGRRRRADLRGNRDHLRGAAAVFPDGAVCRPLLPLTPHASHRPNTSP